MDSSPQQQRRRIAFIDWARLAALGLMVFGHVQDAVLGDAIRATSGYATYDHLRGYTAPLFMLLSGIAFTVSTEAAFEDYLRPSFNLMRRMVRVVALLVIGYALSAPHDEWSELLAMTSDEQVVFWRCNILQSIGASLLLAHLVLLAARSPARAARAAGAIAVALVLATPVVAASDAWNLLPLPLAQAVSSRGGSFFPVFPWAAYFLAGVAGGRLLTSGRLEKRPFVRFAAAGGGALAAACVGVGLWRGWDFNAVVYQPAGIVIFASRLAGALAITGAVGLWAERRRAPVPRLVTMTTQSSLTVYVAHLVLSWGSPWNDGLAQLVPHRYGLGETALAAVAVFAASAAAGIGVEALARIPAALRARAPASFRPSGTPRRAPAPLERAQAPSSPPPAG